MRHKTWFLARMVIATIGFATTAYAQEADAGSACTGNNPVCQLPSADGDDAVAPNGKAHAFAITTFKDGKVTSELGICPDPGRGNCVTPLVLGPVPGRYAFDNKTRIGNLSYSEGGSRLYGTAVQEGRTPQIFVLDAVTGKGMAGIAGLDYQIVGKGRFRGDLAVTAPDGETVSIFDPKDGHSLSGPTNAVTYRLQQGMR